MTLLEGVLVRDAEAPQPEGLTLRDRLLAWRDAITANPAFQRWAGAFPLTRPIARRRARDLFDLCAGFVYTQTLESCVRLGLFPLLADGPRTPASLAATVGLPLEAMTRLLTAATALRLVQPRSGGRVGLGPLGAPLVADPGLLAMVEHGRLLYETLRDPVAVLRGERMDESPISRYYGYGREARPEALDADRVGPYSRLAASSVPPLAAEVLDACRLDDRASLLDVGGGEGAFLSAVGARHAHLQLALFDLPAVTERARARLAQAGLADRSRVHAGSFRTDPLPTGADVITLVRILLDHPDAVVHALLRRVREALPPGGRLIIAEPFAGARGSERVGDVYFAFYLAALSGGRARRPDELHAALADAGFRSSRVVATRYPIYTGVIVAEA